MLKNNFLDWKFLDKKKESLEVNKKNGKIKDIIISNDHRYKNTKLWLIKTIRNIANKIKFESYRTIYSNYKLKNKNMNLKEKIKMISEETINDEIKSIKNDSILINNLFYYLNDNFENKNLINTLYTNCLEKGIKFNNLKIIKNNISIENSIILISINNLIKVNKNIIVNNYKNVQIITLNEPNLNFKKFEKIISDVNIVLITIDRDKILKFLDHIYYFYNIINNYEQFQKYLFFELDNINNEFNLITQSLNEINKINNNKNYDDLIFFKFFKIYDKHFQNKTLNLISKYNMKINNLDKYNIINYFNDPNIIINLINHFISHQKLEYLYFYRSYIKFLFDFFKKSKKSKIDNNNSIFYKKYFLSNEVLKQINKEKLINNYFIFSQFTNAIKDKKLLKIIPGNCIIKIEIFNDLKYEYLINFIESKNYFYPFFNNKNNELIIPPFYPFLLKKLKFRKNLIKIKININKRFISSLESYKILKDINNCKNIYIPFNIKKKYLFHQPDLKKYYKILIFEFDLFESFSKNIFWYNSKQIEKEKYINSNEIIHNLRYELINFYKDNELIVYSNINYFLSEIINIKNIENIIIIFINNKDSFDVIIYFINQNKVNYSIFNIDIINIDIKIKEFKNIFNNLIYINNLYILISNNNYNDKNLIHILIDFFKIIKNKYYIYNLNLYFNSLDNYLLNLNLLIKDCFFNSSVKKIYINLSYCKYNKYIIDLLKNFKEFKNLEKFVLILDYFNFNNDIQNYILLIDSLINIKRNLIIEISIIGLDINIDITKNQNKLLIIDY